MDHRTLLSIHDLMPEKQTGVERTLALLESVGAPPCTLLVVPGSGWEGEGILWLKELQDRGFRLAAHGWAHQAPRPTTLYHRLHAATISRDQGEHLSRTRAELLGLARRSRDWFGQVGLRSPSLYVPPAWAMGALTRRDLKNLPFQTYEVLRGLIHGRTGRLHPLPLVGFEADTLTRKLALRAFNGLNLRLSRITRRPLRISIHPTDLDLLLARDLEKLLRDPWDFLSEGEFLKSG